MTSITHSPVEIQTSPQEVPSVPSWFAEVSLVASSLKKGGVLQAISLQVQQPRPRMGHYEVIDFVAVLIGYSLSGEGTLEAFFERLLPFASPFMALFGRDRLPHRSTLSRFLSAVEPACVEQLRQLFQQDLAARPLAGAQEAGLWDRCGRLWHLFDVDGTRATARQRPLPQSGELPRAQRRLDAVCAPGYTGRKRGEVVATRSVLYLASTHQWLGTFLGKGNGDYQAELKAAIQVILELASPLGLVLSRCLVRLDGLYGNGVLVALLEQAGLGWLMRGKDYGLLKEPGVQERLQQPPDQESCHPETGLCRQLYDFPDLRLATLGPRSRVIVATHPATATKSAVGKTLDGRVYELFFTCLPQDGFAPADVLQTYFGRGGFESVLADEDAEQDPDRWCSHTPDGQAFWHILSQWMWKLRLELGQQLQPSPLRTTVLAAAQLSAQSPAEPAQPPALSHDGSTQDSSWLRLDGYGPPSLPRPLHPGMFGAHDFLPQPDGSLRCPADQPLRVRSRRLEASGTLRVFYSAPPKRCQACHLRAQCLREGTRGTSARHVSLIYPPAEPGALALPPAPLKRPPVAVGALPLLCKDWGRRCTRREWMKLLRSQTVTLTGPAGPPQATAPPAVESLLLTRTQRQHWRLSWQQRVARNAASERTPVAHLHLFGIPTALAAYVGLPSSL